MRQQIIIGNIGLLKSMDMYCTIYRLGTIGAGFVWITAFMEHSTLQDLDFQMKWSIYFIWTFWASE